MREQISVVLCTKFAVICYGSPRKLVHIAQWPAPHRSLTDSLSGPESPRPVYPTAYLTSLDVSEPLEIHHVQNSSLSPSLLLFQSPLGHWMTDTTIHSVGCIRSLGVSLDSSLCYILNVQSPSPIDFTVQIFLKYFLPLEFPPSSPLSLLWSSLTWTTATPS